MEIFSEVNEAGSIQIEAEICNMAATTQWTDLDHYFAALFDQWEGLPIDKKREAKSLAWIPVLRELDDVITSFDEHIGHSDDRFRAWRELHKTAMEDDKIQIPNYPKLRRFEGGEHRWDDNVWERRYCRLVQQREMLTLLRITNIKISMQGGALDFFGCIVESPRRQTLRTPNSARKMRSKWYVPLDELLEEQAPLCRMEKEQLKILFWGEEYRAPGVESSKPAQSYTVTADEGYSVGYTVEGHDGIVVKSEPA